jgi:hypothetical protein
MPPFYNKRGAALYGIGTNYLRPATLYIGCIIISKLIFQAPVTFRDFLSSKGIVGYSNIVTITMDMLPRTAC